MSKIFFSHLVFPVFAGAEEGSPVPILIIVAVISATLGAALVFCILRCKR
jgi:hypothetical protein